MDVFQDYAYYYNLFYQDKDYFTEAKQIDILLKKYGRNIKKIINYGCGTGKHDIELSRIGYQCTGIDISSSMIDIAKKNAIYEKAQIDFSVADIRNYKTREKYDAVISLFHVMSYQSENKDILLAFESARRVLDKGGIFLFDVWYGPGVLSDKPNIRIKEIDDDKNKLIRIAKPIMYDRRNIVDVCYQIFILNKISGQAKEFKEIHTMRYFFRPELEYMLENFGFKILDNLDCNTLGKTDYDSWTSYFIAVAV